MSKITQAGPKSESRTFKTVYITCWYLVPLYFAGTAVAMEKEPGILKEEHSAVVESLRDQIEEDLKKYKSSQ